MRRPRGVGARNETELVQVAQEIEKGGGEVALCVTDVTRRSDLQSLISLGCKRFDRVDVLVNNAGIGPISRFDELRWRIGTR